MLYFDTSLLVAAYVHEAGTDRVLAFFRKQRSERAAISGWVVTEFSAALSIKIRTGHIDDAYRTAALALFDKSIAESMEVLPVATAHFRAAAKFATEHKLGLRAADALHLAIANDSSATLCTFDKRLASAGRALGVATRLV